ncbi:hypothetical protein [Clostridium sp. 1xD42-85]|nr:hypothetical protein [Clostridium sp. 1xD42-85]
MLVEPIGHVGAVFSLCIYSGLEVGRSYGTLHGGETEAKAFIS